MKKECVTTSKISIKVGNLGYPFWKKKEKFQRSHSITETLEVLGYVRAILLIWETKVNMKSVLFPEAFIAYLLPKLRP